MDREQLGEFLRNKRIEGYCKDGLLERFVYSRPGEREHNREGKYKSRKPVEVPDLPRHYARCLRREVSKAALARELGISRPTPDKLIKGQQKGDAQASPSAYFRYRAGFPLHQ